jgi:hypothetical protein
MNPFLLFQLLPKINKYRHSRSKWIAAGRPLRGDERIAEIWDNYCFGCDNREADRCKLCGCFIRRNGTTLNKLAWGTEACDKKLWDIEIPDKEVVVGGADYEEIDRLEKEFEGRKEYIMEDAIIVDRKKPLSSPFVMQKEKGCCE